MRYYLQQHIQIMSHQFSFLQLFAGYNFLQCHFLSISRQNQQLKSLPTDLRVEYCQRIEIMLQMDMSNFQTQICQILRFFGHMLLPEYFSVLESRSSIAASSN